MDKLARKVCLFANDVETTSIWHKALRDQTGFRVYREGIPELLDLYDKYSIKTTFFITGYLANLIPDIVRIIHNRGHEIGSHGYSHRREDGFDIMSFEKQKSHLEKSKALLEDIIGEPVISFRAPALRTSDATALALLETGFKIDSSIASQRFDFFFSYGGVKKLRWLIAPRLPYRVNKNSLLKRGASPLVEVPLTAFIMPYLGTTMRIFPLATLLQHYFVHLESSITGKPVVFDFHPNEIIDESSEERTIINHSRKGVSILFQEFLRNKLKEKNLGRNALLLYERELEFFAAKGYAFMPIKDYCYKEGWL